MKNKLSLFLFLIVLSSSLFGQKDTITSSKKKYKLQTFVQVRSGIEAVKFNPTEGPIIFDNRKHIIQSYAFGLNYQFNNKFSLAVRFTNSYNYEMTSGNFQENISIPEPWYGGRRGNVRSYGLEWSFAYQHFIKNKLAIKTALGFGRNNFTTGGFLDYSDRDAAFSGGDYTMLSKESSFISNKLFLEIGLSKYFSNSRNINLSLVYENFLNPKFIGRYEVKENAILSSGEITKSGNNLALSLTYMLGRKENQYKVRRQKRKQKRSSYVMIIDSLGIKHWESRNSIERRNRKPWHEKSILLHANAGLFFTRNKFTGYENHFNSHFAMSLSTSLSAEIGIKKNLYFETGFSFDKYTVSEKLAEERILDKHYFSASKINIGLGYRVFNKRNNRHGINFQFGASFSVLNSPHSEPIAGYNGGYYPEPDFFYRGYHEYTLFPTVYLGIGKDFEMSKNLFFSMNFRFNQGFIDTYKKEFSLPYTDRDTGEEKFRRYDYTINGTSMNISFGIKYKFLPKKYR